MSILVTVIGVVLLLFGTVFCALGVYGMIRLPDIYSRVHAAGKVTTFGAGAVMLSLFFLTSTRAGIKGLATSMFLLLTAPVISHTLTRTTHRLGLPLSVEPVMDDLTEDKKYTV